MKKRASKKTERPLVRPWTFDEIPIGAVIEFEDKGWSGSSLCREMITGASKSGDEAEVSFGGQRVSVSKLAAGEYNIVRDGFKFACGVMSADHNVLTPMEKFKAAKMFSSIIGASEIFTDEFAKDTLDVEDWLESARDHKVLLGNTGMVKYVWKAGLEPDPDMTLQEMCDSSCIATAYQYVLGRLGLLARVQPGMALPTIVASKVLP